MVSSFPPSCNPKQPLEQMSSMDRVSFFRRAFQSSPSELVSSMDRAALVALFRSTDGANWKTNSNWNTDAGLATWEGVKVNHAGRVVGLSLPNNNLHGPIPEALGALSELKKLFMHDNKLTGPIPGELGALDRLEHLWLDGNQLSGLIPEALGALSELEELFMHDNKLTGSIPGELGALSKLEQLWLHCNQLSGPIPEALGALGELKTLFMHDNKLTGSIPGVLGALGELEELWLNGNQLSGSIPGELGGLGKVQILRLEGNQLTGTIPEALGALSELETLCMNDNKLTGSIPGMLGALGKLEQLFLYGNQLSGSIPGELGGLGKVQILRLDGNQLTGTIPEALGALSELNNLDMGDNKLTGPIPGVLGALGKLEHLFLYGNQLSGSIPGELGGLGKVQILRLDGNQLTGTIPEALGALSELETLCMNDNKLTGSIPGVLGALGKLEQLFLYGNQLSGSIPGELGGLGKVQILRLDGNQLTGTIPEVLGALSELQQLMMHDNKLTGSIPGVLGDLGKLERLGLSGNALSGPIPKALGALSKLEMLLINGNKITGGPAKDESLDSWRARLRQQEQAAEREDTKAENPAARTSSSTQGDKPGKPDRATTGPISGSSREADMDDMTQAQISSFSALSTLCGGRHKSLEQVRQLVEALGINRSSPGTGLSETGTLGEVNRLVAMAEDLGGMVSRHVMNEDIQRRELALPPGPKAYYTAIRTGLCNAYLAASVVCSSLVCTSKTGRMGAAGKTLEFLSSAVPVVSGLAGLAAAALKAGDRYLQTRRVSKICDIAPDSTDCCLLARTLALQLSDGYVDGTLPTTDTAEERGTHTTAGMGGVEGGCGWSQDIGASPDSATEEAVMDWFVEEVADYEPNNLDARKTTPAVQAGRKLGTRHLQTLLKAVGRDCLRGTNTPDEKVKVLVGIILPEAERRVGSTSHGTRERLNHDASSAQPASRQSHAAATRPAVPDGAPKSDIDVAALMERMASMRIRTEATHEELKAGLEASHAKHVELESGLEASHAKHVELESGLEASQAKQVELEAENARLNDVLEAANAKNAKLESEVKILNKMVMKPGPDSDSLVPSGGGQALQQRQAVTERVDDFLERSQERAPAAGNDVVTLGQLAEAVELLKEVLSKHDELHREHDATLSRVQRAVCKITRKSETMSDGLVPQDELRETLALHDELLRELGAKNR
ncbi:Leucine Rich Repeat Protein [Ectocarpus siliculosus]|uniref:Leucine Rich Repeat Protein n=1 Tax=Ectocarpus siliculosus TaxID=2880 RepID=D7FUA0_ECTSI|nr:Leucine Rich Repeat Protein [Ectocarpus siliculosus]|eukprot:CBJ31627.1 Leucine Rich Repeat Protein [Ectocarpus siliculosus]